MLACAGPAWCRLPRAVDARAGLASSCVRDTSCTAGYRTRSLVYSHGQLRCSTCAGIWVRTCVGASGSPVTPASQAWHSPLATRMAGLQLRSRSSRSRTSAASVNGAPPREAVAAPHSEARACTDPGVERWHTQSDSTASNLNL